MDWLVNPPSVKTHDVIRTDWGKSGQHHPRPAHGYVDERYRQCFALGHKRRWFLSEVEPLAIAHIGRLKTNPTGDGHNHHEVDDPKDHRRHFHLLTAKPVVPGGVNQPGDNQDDDRK